MLINLLQEHKIELILASRSSRRSQLMNEAGIPFRLADDYSVEESYPDSVLPHNVPVFLSELKSRAYLKPLENNQIVITADTVVILDGAVLGKPSTREDAIDMLLALSGRVHDVVTGITLRNSCKVSSFSAISKVVFRALTMDEIVYYVDNYAPYDKAGAYAIQEWIGYIGIEKIEGSFYNVMGLPIQTLYRELTKFIIKNR